MTDQKCCGDCARCGMCKEVKGTTSCFVKREPIKGRVGIKKAKLEKKLKLAKTEVGKK